MEKQFDKSDNAYYFFALTLGSVALALLGGSLVDTLVRKVQNDNADFKERSKLKALGFFVIQSFINVFIFLILIRCIPSFTQWLQLSISGALFAVVFFISQKNLTDNVNALTNII